MASIYNANILQSSNYGSSGAPEIEEMRHNICKGAFSVKESSKYLGLGRNKVYDLINANELISFKVGGRRLVLKEELDRFLKEAYAKAVEQTKKGLNYEWK